MSMIISTAKAPFQRILANSDIPSNGIEPSDTFILLGNNRKIRDQPELDYRFGGLGCRNFRFFGRVKSPEALMDKVS